MYNSTCSGNLKIGQLRLPHLPKPCCVRDVGVYVTRRQSALTDVCTTAQYPRQLPAVATCHQLEVSHLPSQAIP